LTASIVRVRGLWKTFSARPAPVAALLDVSFDIEAGAFVTLLGPSGSGKSTALRCIAGLEEPDSGSIEIEGRTVHSSSEGTSVPTHRRRIGMVFQSYAVWPHMTVFGNVAYPLRSMRLPRGDLAVAVDHALDLVGLSGLGRRRATALSGGQQQRVALARALVGRPKLLLLDEPLSSVDAPLRRALQLELKSLQREVGVTTVSVTHDQREAMRMSDEIVVLRSGRVAQEGRPGHLYRHPIDRGVAEMLGPTNIVTGRVRTAPEGHRTEVATQIGVVELHTPAFRVSVGMEVSVSIRPEAIRLITDSAMATPEPCVLATIRDVTYVGASTECVLAVGALELQTRTPGLLEVDAGMQVYVKLDPEGCAVLRMSDVT